jgi:trk system potassium uptake protein
VGKIARRRFQKGRHVHVVVVGCGRVGSSLAVSLTQSGHSVAVVDRNQEAFRRLGADFAGTTVQGVGFDRDRLQEAGIAEASAVAAVTSGDNSNIVIARVARETFGIERVVARIYDPRRAAIYQRLGIATVASVAWTTERVLRRILPEEAAVEWVDPSARVMMIERSVPAAWAGHRLGDAERDGVVRAVVLSRLGVGQVPRPDLVLQEGDIAYFAVADAALADLDARLAAKPSTAAH